MGCLSNQTLQLGVAKKSGAFANLGNKTIPKHLVFFFHEFLKSRPEFGGRRNEKEHVSLEQRFNLLMGARDAGRRAFTVDGAALAVDAGRRARIPPEDQTQQATSLQVGSAGVAKRGQVWVGSFCK